MERAAVRRPAAGRLELAGRQARRGAEETAVAKAAGGRRAGRGWVSEHETLQQAGRRMRDLGSETVPVRGDDGRIRGVNSREQVIRHIAAGADPKTVTAGDLIPGQHQPERPPAGPQQTARAHSGL